MENKLKDLMERREEISFAMIEADSSEYQELQEEMKDIENEIELSTGKSMEEMENEFYEREA